jgi:hypothetical protein
MLNPKQILPFAPWQDVRYGPIADIPACSFDYLVGAPEKRHRDREPERLGGLEVQDQLDLGRMLNF